METFYRQLRDRRNRITLSDIKFQSHQMICWAILSIANIANAQNHSETTQNQLRDGDEFANNLISDLAPLLTLFGERFAQQFLSFSTSWFDSLIFSMAPLGVITAIVGAIRVGGPSWLRSIIGRARETTAAAEVELMSSTSHEVCELWNGDSIVRVMGSPHIQQLIYFQGLESYGDDHNIFTLEEAKEKEYLKKKDLHYTAWLKSLPFLNKLPEKNAEDLRQTRKEAPNISLNLGVRAEPWELYSAAVFGIIVQAAVLAVGAIVTYAPGWSLKKGGLVVSDYSYLLNVVGTLMLIQGMFIMASVVEQSTHEDRWVATDKSSKAKIFIIWLQRGRVINDQEFRSVGLVTNNPVKVIRTSRRQRRANSGGSRSGLSSPLMCFFTVWGTGVSVIGFILQFMGLRGLHWLASASQLCATVIMTIIRALLRRGISKRPTAYDLTKDCELEWLAAALAKNPENFGDKYSKSEPETRMGCVFRVSTLRHKKPDKKVPDWFKIMRRPPLESKLSRLSLKRPGSKGKGVELPIRNAQSLNSSGIIKRRIALGKSTQWTGPASDVAIATTNAIEAVMNTLFASRTDKNFEWTVDLRCGVGKCGLNGENEEKLSLSVTKSDSDKWTTDVSKIEAILSLWLHNARESESKKAYQAQKNTEKTSDWLRRKPRNQNMRFLGPDSITLRRDLRWWTPGGAMSLLEVNHSEVLIDSNLNSEPDHYTIDYHRITGLHTSEIPEFTCTEHNRLADSTEEHPSCRFPTAIRFRSKVIFLQEYLGTPRSLDIEQQKMTRDDETSSKPAKDDVQNTSTALAVVTSTPIELLFGQHLFGTFIAKVAKELGRIGGDSTPQTSRNIYPSGWHNFQLTNTVISQLALGIQNAGLSTSLEEAYICIIPPFSQEHKLPIDAAVDLVLQNIDEDERNLNWEKCTETYLELLKVCKEFNSDRCLFTIKVATAIMAYVEHLTDAKETVSKEDTSKAEILEKSIRKLQKRVIDDLPGTITNIGYLLKRLCHLQGLDRAKFPETYLSPELNLKAQSKYKPDEFLKHVGHSQLLIEISTGNQHWSTEKFKANLDEQDIFGWSALHYLVCKTPKDYGPDFVTIKSREIIHLGANPNIRDIAGRTPLHYAALTSKHTAAVALSLIGEPGVNLDIQAKDGRTPLHYAAAVGDSEFLKGLLKKNAKIDLLDNKKQTPLHMAVRKKNKRAIQLLLQNEASTSIYDYHKHTAFHLAAMAGDKDCLDLLFHRSDPNARDHNGRTALHLATIQKNTNIVQFLLDKRVYRNTKDNEGQTALHLAARNANATMVRTLLDKNVNSTNQRQDGQNLLSIATVSEEKVHEAVQNTSNPNESILEMKDSHGRTPLLIAATKGAEIIKLLLEYEANRETIDDEGNGAIHFAAMIEDYATAVEVIEVLREEKFNLSIANKAGENFLHVCCRTGSANIMSRLLRDDMNTKEIINKTDNAGRTPLHIALESSNPDLATLLLGAGASPDLLISGQVNSDLSKDYGDTALHSAVKRGQLHLVGLLLVTKGDLINTTNNRGRSALHIAAMMGSEEIVKKVLEHNPSIDQEDSAGDTALHLACTGVRSSTKIVECLLAKGAFIDCQNNKRETPLYISSKMNNKALVHTLVSSGADICIQTMKEQTDGKTAKHRTALHVASKRGFVDILRVLVPDTTKNSCLNIQDAAGNTALHLSCSAWRSASEKSAIFLVDAGADAKLRNQKGDTALHSAAKGSYPRIIRRILKKYADIANLVTKKNRTALHQAVKRGHIDVVEALLKSYQKDYQQRLIGMHDVQGETVLHLALRYQYREARMLKVLVDTYRPPIDAQNNCGENVLHYAASSNNDEAIQMLLNVDNAEGVRVALTQENQIHQTPLHRAVLSIKSTRTIFSMLHMLSMIDSNFQDTAFHTAIVKGNTNVVAFFIFEGLNTDFKDTHGWTPSLCVSEVSVNSELYGWIQTWKPEMFYSTIKPEVLTASGWEEFKTYDKVKHDQSHAQVDYILNNESDYDNSVLIVKANHPLRPIYLQPKNSNIKHDSARYYEITILKLNTHDNIIGLGLSNGPISEYAAMPGWNRDTWGYHGDDGKKFGDGEPGSYYGPKYKAGDTVGCGVDLDGTVFFTKNGRFLGDAFTGIRGQLFPIIGFSPGGCVTANFGPEFKYKFVKAEQAVPPFSSSMNAVKIPSRTDPENLCVHAQEPAESQQNSTASPTDIISGIGQKLIQEVTNRTEVKTTKSSLIVRVVPATDKVENVHAGEVKETSRVKASDPE